MEDNKLKKSQKKMRVVFHHIKPKDEKETKEQIAAVNAAFDILFKEVWEDRKNKK